MNKKILFILIALFILLRIPSLFEPYWHGDEGITLTVGQTIARGAVLYRDITDNKTPLLYFIAALAGNLFNFKLITLVFSLGALITFIRVRDMMIRSPEYISLLLFAVLASTPLLEANIANAEIYMVLPIIVSVIAYMKKRYVLAGVLGAFSFLLKPPGMFEVGALMLHALLTDKYYKSVISKIAFGFSIPIAVISIYFLSVGGLSSFVSEAFVSNILYTGSWYLITDPKVWMMIKLGGLGAFVWYLVRSKRLYQSSELLLYLWLLFSLFGATLSNRPYSHYLIQIVPPVSLLLGSILRKNYRKAPAVILLGAVIFFCIVQFKLHGGTLYYTYSYYSQFHNPAFFDQRVTVTDEVTDYMLKNTRENEPIFVWSDNSLIYAKTKRPAATKYVSAYHVAGNADREEEVMDTLQKNSPRVIVITKPIDHTFKSLLLFVEMRYNLAVTTDQFDIYELKSD